VDSATTLRVTAPMSTGDWQVMVELINPSGLMVRRSDLFSYYSTAVSVQPVLPAVPSNQGASVLRVAPQLTPQRGGIVIGAGTGQLRGLLLSSDGQTVSDLWTLVGPPNLNALLIRDL